LRLILLILFYFASVLPALAGQLQPQLLARAEQQPTQLVSVIVSLIDQADITPFAVHGEQRQALNKAERHERRSGLVRALRDKARLSQRGLRSFLKSQGITHFKNLWAINSLAFEIPPHLLPALAAHPAVAEVRLDQLVHLPETPRVEPLATNGIEDNLSLIHAPELWAQGITGQGVTVAIIDSGVDVQHPELGPKWRGGTNSWFNAVAPGCSLLGASCTSCDSNTTAPCDFLDSFGTAHGTGVAGILVGGDLGGTAIGVAPDAQWIAAKIFDSTDSATFSNIHSALAWMLDPDGDPQTDDAPDVVNNSWGFSAADGCFQEFSADLQTLQAAGIAVVFSGGNNGPNPGTSVSPANNLNGYGVGYVGTTSSATEIGEFSSRGPSSCDGSIFPEVVAPGFNLRSTDFSFGGLPLYVDGLTGTSFAAPHVAGAMALLLSAAPSLSVDELEQVLILSAADTVSPDDPVGPDNSYGNGLIDALAAYNMVTQLPPVLEILDPVLPDDDQFLPYGDVLLNETVNQNLTLRNAGGGTLQILGIDRANLNVPFVLSGDTCTGQLLTTGQICSLTVDFSPTTPGSFSGSLTVLSDDGQQPNAIVTFTGSGAGQVVPPELQVTDSTSQSFSQVVPGTSVVANITLKNIGIGPLQVQSLDLSSLSAPFSIAADACTGASLLAGQSCIFQVQFAPLLAGPYTGSVTVNSNDPVQPQVSVPVAGTSNTPPPAASLRSPADGSFDQLQNLTLSWIQLPDADAGQTVSNTLLLDTNPHFFSPQVIPVARVFGPTLTVGLLACLVPLGLVRRRRYLLLFLLGAGLLLLVSCGGSGGGSSSVDPNLRSQTVSGLAAATTYYWKVVSEDGQGGESQSSTFFFTTQ
jgi:hypothetical protein